MSKVKKVRSKVIHAKMFVQRSMSYIAILNSGMILFLVLSRLENYNIDIKLERWFLPIFIVTLFIMLFFGYLEDKLGFHEAEMSAHTSRNPVFTELNKKLDRIEKKLNEK